MTRTLLTAIFLTLFSQAAWSFDCDLVQHKISESIHNIKVADRERWKIRRKIVDEQDGQHLPSQNKTLNAYDKMEAEYLEKLNKWAAVYSALYQ